MAIQENSDWTTTFTKIPGKNWLQHTISSQVWHVIDGDFTNLQQVSSTKMSQQMESNAQTIKDVFWK